MKLSQCVCFATGIIGFAMVAVADPQTLYWDFAKAGDCSAPDKAGDWTVADNWRTEGGQPAPLAPNGAEFTVCFDVEKSKAGVCYVRIPSEITVGKIIADGTGLTADNRLILLGDGVLTVAGGDTLVSKGCVFFCDVRYVSSGAQLQSSWFCGEVGSSSALVVSEGSVEHRLDRFAYIGGGRRDQTEWSVDMSPAYAAFNTFAPGGLSSEVSGTWRLTAGKSYATRAVVGADVVVGAVVSADCAAFPAGTFVKRLFDANTIELSSPALVSSESAELRFSPINQTIVSRIGTYRRHIDAWGYYDFGIMQGGSGVESRLLIDTLGGSDGYANRYYKFCTQDGYAPGAVVIRDAYWRGYKVRLMDCHLEFGIPLADGAMAGFPNADNIHLIDGKTARITVPSGVQARMASVTEMNGSLIKDGQGALEIELTAATSTPYVNGTVVIEQGELVVAGDGPKPKRITVNGGAAVRVNGEVSADLFDFKPGAIVSGGTILVDSATKIPAGVQFIRGGCVRVVGGSGEIVTRLPAGDIVGNPVFWVDFSNPKCYSFASEEEMTVNLIKDVRSDTMSGCLTAAPAGDLCPRREPTLSVGGAVGALWIPYRSSASAAPSETYDPIWSRSVTNIRTVFMVVYVSGYSWGGGQFLGWTGVDAGDFMRGQGEPFLSSMFYSGALPDKVKNAPMFVNGLPYDYKEGYPYQMTATANGNAYTPVVVELHALADCKADSFAHNGNAGGRNGGQILCECVIYTNELSEAQTLAVRRKLMNKWLNCEPQWVPGPSGSAIGEIASDFGVATAQSESLYIGAISNGEVIKSGEGNLYVNLLNSSDGSLSVTAGKVTIKSDALTESSLPTGAVVHLDASRISTMMTNRIDDETYVTKWSDCRAGSSRYAYADAASASLPTLRPVAELGGRTVVDFGIWKHVETSRLVNASAMGFNERSTHGHTVIGLFGTQNGGGQIVGGAFDAGIGRNGGWGIMRGNGYGASKDDALVNKDIIGPYQAYEGTYLLTNSVLARVNQRRVNAFTDGCSGGWDIISLTTWQDVGLGGLCSADWVEYSGGQAIAEILEYPYGLSNVETERVEAYLKKKWWGNVSAGYGEASVGELSVSAGASVEIDGDGALSALSISGSGLVVGDVVLNESGEVRTLIRENGEVETLQIDGVVTLPHQATVCLRGNIADLPVGQHVLISSPSIRSGELTEWAVTYSGKTRRILTLFTVDGGLILDVKKQGLCVIVR